MAGGSEQQTPTQASVTRLGRPSASVVPARTTGVGKPAVIGPMFFFIILPP